MFVYTFTSLLLFKIVIAITMEFWNVLAAEKKRKNEFEVSMSFTLKKLTIRTLFREIFLDVSVCVAPVRGAMVTMGTAHITVLIHHSFIKPKQSESGMSA